MLAAHRGVQSVTAAQVEAMPYWSQSGGDLLRAIDTYPGGIGNLILLKALVFSSLTLAANQYFDGT
jgi:hypothetical protein